MRVAMRYAFTAAALVLVCGAEVFAQRSASVRSTDFSNFTYAGSRGHFPAPEYETTRFTLREGKFGDWRRGMSLREVTYGDATGDGVEEAFVVLNVETDGSAAVNHVYVYTLKNRRPEFLWGFESGDRAWGGLRRVYARGGSLVVELWGRGNVPGRELGVADSEALCCPKSYTRTFYRWEDGSFRQRGEAEVLPNPIPIRNER